MPKKRNIDSYSLGYLRDIEVIGSFVVANFLKDDLAEEDRDKILARLASFRMFTSFSDEAKAMYKGLFPDFCKKVKNDDLEAEIIYNVEERNVSHPDPYFNGTSSKFDLYLTDDKWEEVIELMVSTLKNISELLDQYLETDELTEAERKYIYIVKEAVDDLAYQRGFGNKMGDNNAYGYVIHSIVAGLNTNKFQFVPVVNGKEVSYKIDGLNDKVTDWKKIFASLNDTPIGKVYLGACDVTKQWNTFMSDGDADREDMISIYDKFANDCLNMQNMSKETFNDIKNKTERPLQNEYDEFTKGSRAPIYMHWEAVAKAALLKAGYPKSDLVMLSQFYIKMMAQKHSIDLSADDKDMGVYLRKLEQWNKLIAPGAITAEERVKRITALKSFVESEKTFRDDRLSKALNRRINAKLSIYETLGLSGNVSEYYTLLDSPELDPGYIKSSSQYKDMKEALNMLNKIDKNNYPEQYKLKLNDTISKTKAYLEYKKAQNRKAGSKHTRSELEAKRVNAAGAILDGLNREKNEIYYKELSIDERKVLNQAADIDSVRELTEAYELLTLVKAEILNKLNEIKSNLKKTQSDINGNFENQQQKEGSKYYKAMTDSIQSAIDAISNPSSSIDDINSSLDNLVNSAGSYKNDKEGITGHPTTGNAGVRYNASLDLTGDIPMVKNVFANIYHTFDKYKDMYHIPVGSKSFADIEKTVTDVYGGHEAEFKAAPKNNVSINDRLDALKSRASIQTEIRAKLSKLCPSMENNYDSKHKPDYYVALKSGIGTSDLALNYMTVKYLDEIYNPATSIKRLEQMSEDISIGFFKEQVKDLSKSPAFKRTVSANPKTAFSEWSKIDKRADEIVKGCEDTLVGYANMERKVRVRNENGQTITRNEAYGSISSYVGSGEGIFERGADVIVNYMLNVQVGRVIVEAIAADNNVNLQNVMDKMKKDVKKFLSGRPNYHPTYFINDEVEIGKMKKFLINSCKDMGQNVNNIDNHEPQLNVNNNQNLAEDKPKISIKK